MGNGRALAKGSALRLLSFVASAGTALVMMPFVVHRIGDAQYGMWTLVAGYVGYYGLLDFGLSSAVTRHCAGALGQNDRPKVTQLVNTAFRIYVGVAALVLVIAAVTAAVLPSIWPTLPTIRNVSKLAFIVGCSLAVSFPLRVFVGVLNANVRFDITATLEMTTLAVRTCLVIVFINAGFSVIGLGWATFASTSVSLVLHVIAVRRVLPWLRIGVRGFQSTVARSLLSYGSSSFVIQVSDVLRFQLDGMVVAAFVGAAAVTHYGIASTLVQYFINIILAIFGVLVPVFSAQADTSNSEALKRTYFFSTRVCIIASTFIAFGLIAWGRSFLIVWMGPRYSDSYPVLVVLTVGAMTALWQNPSVQLLYSISKHRFFAIANVAEGIANLILSISLAHRFGMIGVALGTFIPMIIMKVAIQPLYVIRSADMSLKEYIGVAGQTLIVAIVALIPGALLSMYFVQPALARLASTGVVALFCYIAVVSPYVLAHGELKLFRRAKLSRPASLSSSA